MVKGKNKTQMQQKKVSCKTIQEYCSLHSLTQPWERTRNNKWTVRQRKLKNSIRNRSLKEATELQKELQGPGDPAEDASPLSHTRTGSNPCPQEPQCSSSSRESLQELRGKHGLIPTFLWKTTAWHSSHFQTKGRRTQLIHHRLFYSLMNQETITQSSESPILGTTNTAAGP